MKSFVVFVCIVLTSVSALAGTCTLDQPITFSGEVLSGVRLQNVVLDESPRFMSESEYNPGTDVLDLYLFDIELNQTNTGFLGSRIYVRNKHASVGFSESYSGNFQMGGSKNETNGVKTYATKESRFFSEPQHAKNEAITQTTVTVANGKITSINVTFPLFKVWKTVDHVNYVAFTGEHQTVCVKSAR